MKDLAPNFLAPRPVTSNGSCGYLLPLRPERLKTFTPDPQSVPAIGQNLTLFLGGTSRAAVAIDGYVEAWQGDPAISVAVLAKISPADTKRFRNTASNYFLLSTASLPPPVPFETDLLNHPVRKTTGLKSFGSLGELRLFQGEAGWAITLLRSSNGAMRQTSLSYECGD